jgi:hypothetical protein
MLRIKSVLSRDDFQTNLIPLVEELKEDEDLDVNYFVLKTLN